MIKYLLFLLPLITLISCGVTPNNEIPKLVIPIYSESMDSNIIEITYTVKDNDISFDLNPILNHLSSNEYIVKVDGRDEPYTLTEYIYKLPEKVNHGPLFMAIYTNIDHTNNSKTISLPIPYDPGKNKNNDIISNGTSHPFTSIDSKLFETTFHLKDKKVSIDLGPNLKSLTPTEFSIDEDKKNEPSTLFNSFSPISENLSYKPDKLQFRFQIIDNLYYDPVFLATYTNISDGNHVKSGFIWHKILQYKNNEINLDSCDKISFLSARDIEELSIAFQSWPKEPTLMSLENITNRNIYEPIKDFVYKNFSNNLTSDQISSQFARDQRKENLKPRFKDVIPFPKNNLPF